MPHTQIIKVDTLPTDRPILVLDVDGVLNVCDFESKDGEVYDIFEAMSYVIHLRWDMADWLWELTQHYVPVWGTTWDENANHYFADRLRLPYLPVIPTREAKGRGFYGDKPSLLRPIGGGVHWKMSALVKYLKDRPFVFVDDDISEADHMWAAKRTAEGIPTEMLWTDDREGLTREGVDKLIRWAQAWRAAQDME